MAANPGRNNSAAPPLPGTGPGSAPPKNPFAKGPQMPPGGVGDDEEFEEDLTGVTAGFPKCAEGVWFGYVTEISKEPSRNSGQDQYVWDFEICNGPSKGMSQRSYTSLSPNARFKVVEHLEACGIQASDKVVRFKKSQVLGQPVVLEISHGEFTNAQGQKRERSQVDLVSKPTEECIKVVEAYKAAKAGKPNVPANA